MANEFRVFGKEVTIRFTRSGNIISEITAIKNFTFETRQRIITDQYLGETASRQDEIFDEVGGSFTVHPEGTDILELQKLIADRSQRRQSVDEEINCTFRIAFPNGASPKITIPDMHFDPIPLNVPNRDAYVEMSFTYKATGYLLTL
jgi:hypothetical protein